MAACLGGLPDVPRLSLLGLRGPSGAPHGKRCEPSRRATSFISVSAVVRSFSACSERAEVRNARHCSSPSGTFRITRSNGVVLRQQVTPIRLGCGQFPHALDRPYRKAHALRDRIFGGLQGTVSPKAMRRTPAWPCSRIIYLWCRVENPPPVRSLRTKRNRCLSRIDGIAPQCMLPSCCISKTAVWLE